MERRLFSLALIISSLIICCRSSFAEQPDVFTLSSKRITLVEQVPFSGEVARVLMVALSDLAPPEVVEASWVAPEHDGQFSCIGAFKLAEAVQRLGVLSLIIGTNGEVRSAYGEFIAEELSPVTRMTLIELRDRFIERRGVYRSLQQESEEQEGRLRALQKDADAIAMVSKIVSAEDELSQVREKLKRVVAAEEGIDRKISQMRNRPVPLNAQKRESELEAYLASRGGDNSNIN